MNNLCRGLKFQKLAAMIKKRLQQCVNRAGRAFPQLFRDQSDYGNKIIYLIWFVNSGEDWFYYTTLNTCGNFNRLSMVMR